MGARSIRHCAGIDVCDLHRDVAAFRGAGVLLPAASGEHDVVHLHAAAFDDPDAVERRHRLARNEVSARRTAEGNGVTSLPFDDPIQHACQASQMSTTGMFCQLLDLGAQERNTLPQISQLLPELLLEVFVRDMCWVIDVSRHTIEG